MTVRGLPQLCPECREPGLDLKAGLKQDGKLSLIRGHSGCHVSEERLTIARQIIFT